MNWMKKNVRRATFHINHFRVSNCIVIVQVQNVPRCPICRTALTQGSLIIPNFALKHNIEKHILALTEMGVMDWQPRGRLYTQWAERNA